MVCPVDHKEVDEYDRDSEGFADTEDEECEFGEFFEGREKYGDDIHGHISVWEKWLEYVYEVIFCEEISENRDKITSFDIQLKEEKRDFFPWSRVMNRPVKW